MKILGIDPGEHTGVVLMDTDQPNALKATLVVTWHGLDDIIHTHHPDIIVMESFRLYPHMAQTMIANDFPSSQVIGVVKYLAEKVNIPVAMQPASMAKYVKPKRMFPSPHLHDAYCHIEAYRRKHGDKVCKAYEGDLQAPSNGSGSPEDLEGAQPRPRSDR